MASLVEGNEDLLNEILLRLPVKSLMRFKCVSKNWLAHISNPCFCRSHTLHQNHPPHPFPSALLVTPKISYNLSRLIVPSTISDSDIIPYTPTSIDFHFLDVMNFTIEKSCNGLLLIRGYLPTRYFVCNPITKQFFVLSLPRKKDHTYKAFQLHLGYNPLRSSHYKVIFMRFKGLVSLSGDQGNLDTKIYTQHEFEINVYSSKTGCWSDFGICVRDKGCLILNSGTYCNGAIYWFNYAENSRYCDVENQCFKTFPMPPYIKKSVVQYFGESGGHLHMILKVHSHHSFFLDVLELKEDNSRWSLRFIVDLRESFRDIGPLFEVLCIFRQEKEEDSVIVLSNSCGVISYNLLDYTIRRLNGFNPFLCWDEYNPVRRFQVLQYFQNLSWDGDSSVLLQVL